MEQFLDKWQTLIGSALGAVLAITGSVFLYVIKSIYEEMQDRKEFLRQIEIGITRSLDETAKARVKLQDFVSRLRQLIIQIRSIKSDNFFSLDSINFPTIREIYRNIDAPNFKIKSYYLHNKLLWADAGIKETNETVINLKNDFVELLRKNELNILLIRQNTLPDPTPQRAQYADNLESFANAIDDFINKFFKQGIEIMVQIKVYNEQLRKKFGWLFLWRQEGTKYKYFSNKNEQKKFAKNLDSLDRIDKVIQKEVDGAINDMEQRSTQLLK